MVMVEPAQIKFNNTVVVRIFEKYNFYNFIELEQNINSTDYLKSLNYKVEFVYVLNQDWFGKAEYKDVLDYIQSMNCHYVFDEIPLSWLGLPVAE